MRAIIFANGVINHPFPDEAQKQPGDIVIAADGGSINCLRTGQTPDVLIGDLDSLTREQVNALESAGCKVIRFPEKKDYTDLELAVQYAMNEGFREILILGALGRRWDQTLANLMLPAAAPFSQANIRLIDGQQEISFIQSGHKMEIHGRRGDTFSLIPLSGDASGITTEGLEYPLQDEKLIFGATRGVSNVLLSETAQVIVDKGLLLAVLIHQPFLEGTS